MYICIYIYRNDLLWAQDNPGNIQRDLKTKFFKHMVSPECTMIKTTVKAKTTTGVEKEVPGEVPVLLPEDWVGCLKESTFDAVLGMDGVANFWKDQLQWENPRIKASKDLFQEPCQGQGQGSGCAVCLCTLLLILCFLFCTIFGIVDPQLGLESHEALTLLSSGMVMPHPTPKRTRC